MSAEDKKKSERLIDQMTAIAMRAKASSRNLSPSECDEYDRLKAKFEELQRDDESTPSDLLGAGIPLGQEHLYFDSESPRKTERRKYRSLFGSNTPRGGFRDFEDFLAAVHSNRYDPRLEITRSLGESVSGLGGFMVPAEFSAEVLDAALENEIVRPRADVVPMNSQTKKIPGFDGADHTNALFGGFSGQWMSEGGTATVQDAKFRLIELVARKLVCYCSVSNELIADGMKFENVIGDALVKSISWYLDYAFLQGLGGGQPVGVLHDPALITITKESGQATGTILYANLTKMFARIHPAFVANAIWIANSSTIPQLLSLSIPIGTAGSYVPVMNQENGKFYILGKEVVFTEKLPALSSKGDIILADLSQYAVGLRKEVSLERSNAPGWLTDQASFRSILRADGQGKFDRAITPKNGSSLSWCVTVEAR